MEGFNHAANARWILWEVLSLRKNKWGFEIICNEARMLDFSCVSFVEDLLCLSTSLVAIECLRFTPLITFPCTPLRKVYISTYICYTILLCISMYLSVIGSLFISAGFISFYIIICKHILPYMGMFYLLWGSIACKLLLIVSIKVYAVMNNSDTLMHLNMQMYEYASSLHVHHCHLSNTSTFSQNCSTVQALAIKVAISNSQ